MIPCDICQEKAEKIWEIGILKTANTCNNKECWGMILYFNTDIDPILPEDHEKEQWN